MMGCGLDFNIMTINYNKHKIGAYVSTKYTKTKKKLSLFFVITKIKNFHLY